MPKGSLRNWVVSQFGRGRGEFISSGIAPARHPLTFEASCVSLLSRRGRRGRRGVAGEGIPLYRDKNEADKI